MPKGTKVEKAYEEGQEMTTIDISSLDKAAVLASQMPTGHHEELERIWRDAEHKLHTTRNRHV